MSSIWELFNRLLELRKTENNEAPPEKIKAGINGFSGAFYEA